MQINIKTVFIIIIALAIGAFSSKLIFPSSDNTTNTPAQTNSGPKITIYKSPTCGCCGNYSAYLEKQGFDVEVVETNDIASIKTEHNIPHDLQSCHTAIIDGYFVEGHVPVEAINKLLAEKPEIDGIGLPGMPAGSPGMPGFKQEEFQIYSLSDSTAGEFLKI